MSAHHYAARHFELPLGLYVSERTHALIKQGARMFAFLSRWLENRSAAERLAVLDDHLLRDIGIENRHLIEHYVRKGRR